MLTKVLLINFMAFISISTYAQCKNVKLQVLGSGGPELDDGRNSSSYILWNNNKSVLLVDTGPGTSTSFSKTGAKFEDLQAVLFTHFHVDHSADFPALIKGSFFTKRAEDLQIFGPSGNEVMPSATEYLSRTFGRKGVYAYLNPYLLKEGRAKYKIVATNIPLTKRKTSSYSVGNNIKIFATAIDHGPIAAIAWRIEIKGCSIVFSEDMTNKFDTLTNFSKNAEVLVASNSIPEQASSRAKTLHMPPTEIGLIGSCPR